jgi:hypothetical protein
MTNYKFVNYGIEVTDFDHRVTYCPIFSWVSVMMTNYKFFKYGIEVTEFDHRVLQNLRTSVHEGLGGLNLEVLKAFYLG